MDELAIKVDDVSKDFVLAHEKATSVKGVFIGMFRHATEKKEKQHALRNVSFEVKKGEFFGIVGRNGSGKSTLLKILAGIYQPNKGKVQVDGRLVPFIELGIGFNGELSGRDNVYLNGAMLGFSESEIDTMYDDIVSFAELERFMDQKLKNYSSGMQVRLAFSMATRAKADILLIDEVLAVGDASFQKKCYEYFRELKRAKKTVVFVSHDMGAIQQYCDRALMIEKSKIVAEDRPAIIASKYNRMFADEAMAEDKKRRSTGETIGISGEERWGDDMARIISVDTIVEETTNKHKGWITIRVKVKANQALEVPILGFSVKNSRLEQLLGTNTVRKKYTLKPMQAGEELELEWKFANIFNEGIYYLDCTVAHDEAASVADRWPDADSFRIIREESTPYQLNPQVEVSVK